MAMDVTATKQLEFATVMLQKLKEEKGSKLESYAERAVVTGADTYKFYRLGESAVGNNTINMYSDSYTGTGGTSETVQAVIDYIYAHDKIGLKEMNSTSLNLESSYIKSLSDALHRNIDKKICDTIKAGTAQLTKAGDALKEITDDANVTALIQSIAYATTLVKETSVSEGRSGVALVLDTTQYSKLFAIDKVLSAEYPSVNEFRTRNMLFGADVVKVAGAVKDKDTMYIVPQGCFGVATWENDIFAESWFDKGQDKLFCKVRRSIGVVLIEPESIVEFKHKAFT